MKKLSDLSIADLKAAREFTEEQIIELSIESKEMGFNHSTSIRLLQNLRDKIQNTLFSKVHLLKNYEYEVVE